jgi:hypothetical protein
MEARYSEIINCIDNELAQIESQQRLADPKDRNLACLQHAFYLGEVVPRGSPKLSRIAMGKLVRVIIEN